MRDYQNEKVTIIGAGVTGLCLATELAERDVPLRIIDRHGPPAAHSCSWWAGGMLAPFCEGETAAEPVVRFGREAADWWQRHDVKVTRNGSLVVALGRDQSELDLFARRTEGHDWVDADGIRALEPALAGQISRGLFFPDEAHLSPRDALSGLVQALAGRNITIETEEMSDRPEEENATGEPIQFLDCRGLAASDALRDLRGVRGEMLIIRSKDITLSRPIRLLHPRIPIYLVPRGEGIFMLGATMIETDSRNGASVRSVLELLSAAYALHPAFGEAEILEIGADARPAFPDNLPRIRRRGRRLYLNGLFRHGFLLAPALARMAADFMFSKTTIPEVMDEH
jgi:glycine oxidase